MEVRAIAFLCLAFSYQVNCSPFLSTFTGQDPVYNSYSGYSGRLGRLYRTCGNNPANYKQISIDPATGQVATTYYTTHKRPCGPITTLFQNTLNTVGRLFGDIGGALGNALGDAISGVGQFGQDIHDFVKPYVAPPPLRPVLEPKAEVVVLDDDD